MFLKFSQKTLEPASVHEAESYSEHESTAAFSQWRSAGLLAFDLKLIYNIIKLIYHFFFLNR